MAIITIVSGQIPHIDVVYYSKLLLSQAHLKKRSRVISS